MESLESTLTGYKGRKYPYICHTDFVIKPTDISHEQYGHFICIPDPRNRTKIWGFEEEAGHGLFYLDHKEHIIK